MKLSSKESYTGLSSFRTLTEQLTSTLMYTYKVIVIVVYFDQRMRAFTCVCILHVFTAQNIQQVIHRKITTQGIFTQNTNRGWQIHQFITTTTVFPNLLKVGRSVVLKKQYLKKKAIHQHTMQVLNLLGEHQKSQEEWLGTTVLHLRNQNFIMVN